jgi:hypothetical protein
MDSRESQQAGRRRNAKGDGAISIAEQEKMLEINGKSIHEAGSRAVASLPPAIAATTASTTSSPPFQDPCVQAPSNTILDPLPPQNPLAQSLCVEEPLIDIYPPDPQPVPLKPEIRRTTEAPTALSTKLEQLRDQHARVQAQRYRLLKLQDLDEQAEKLRREIEDEEKRKAG